MGILHDGFCSKNICLKSVAESAAKWLLTQAGKNPHLNIWRNCIQSLHEICTQLELTGHFSLAVYNHWTVHI